MKKYKLFTAKKPLDSSSSKANASYKNASQSYLFVLSLSYRT